jgi:hypothetical protein
MIPKSVKRFPACAQPRRGLWLRIDACAGEGRSEKIMLGQKEAANIRCVVRIPSATRGPARRTKGCFRVRKSVRNPRIFQGANIVQLI